MLGPPRPPPPRNAKTQQRETDKMLTLLKGILPPTHIVGEDDLILRWCHMEPERAQTGNALSKKQNQEIEHKKIENWLIP